MARMSSELVISLVDHVTAPSRAVSKAVTGLTRASQENARQLNAVRGQMVDAAAGAYLLAKALSAPVEAATAFQSAMADVRKVTGFDAAGLTEFGKELRSLSTGEIPMAVEELAALAAGGAQGGVADAELQDFTEIAAKSAVAWEMAGGATGTSLAHIKTALQLTVSELGLYSDAINYLSNNTASAAPQLVDFTERVGAQGKVYGYSKEQSLAFGAAMIGSGADANVAATSFRNMGRALTRGASATKRQREAMKDLGLDAQEVAARMQKDAVGTTLDVMARIGQLPAELQAATTTDIFGDEARALAPLLGNLDELQRVLGMVSTETNYAGSAQQEFEVRSQTFENSVQRLKNQINDLAISIGNALLPSLNDLLGAIGPVIMAISEWAEAHPDLVRNIIFTVSALVGLRVATIAARYAFLFMKGGVIDTSLALTKFAAAATAAAVPARQMIGLQKALAVGSGVKYTGLMALVDGLRGMALAVPGVSLLSGALSAVGASVAAITAPVWGVVAAVVALAAAIGILVYKYWEPLSNFFIGLGEVAGQAAADVANAIGSFAAESLINVGKLFGIEPAEMQAAIDNTKTTIQMAWDGLVQWLWDLPGQVGNWMGDLFKMENFSDEEEAGFRDAGRRAGQAVIDAATGLMSSTAVGFHLVYDIGIGAIDPFIQWLHDVAVNGLNIAVDIGKAAGDAAGGAVKSAGDAWNSATGAVSGLFGGGATEIPARAGGGPVASNVPYLVGELGPELFMPGVSGTIRSAQDTARLLAGITPRAPSMPSFANDNAANGNAAGSRTVTIGAIHVHEPGASADEIADAIGRRIWDRAAGSFDDGAF